LGSAWLIRKFIDPRATFVFAAKPDAHPDAIPYEMMDVEFTHHGDDCTFETLLKRFAIADAAARRIGEMIHDADLEDGKFQRRSALSHSQSRSPRGKRHRPPLSRRRRSGGRHPGCGTLRGAGDGWPSL